MHDTDGRGPASRDHFDPHWRSPLSGVALLGGGDPFFTRGAGKEEAPISVLASPAPRGSNTYGYYRSGSYLDAGYKSYSIWTKNLLLPFFASNDRKEGGKDARQTEGRSFTGLFFTQHTQLSLLNRLLPFPLPDFRFRSVRCFNSSIWNQPMVLSMPIMLLG